MRFERLAAVLAPRPLAEPRLSLFEDGFGSGRAALITYLMCCALVVVLLPLDGAVSWAEVGPALALIYLGPTGLSGPPRYPAGSLRSGLLFTVIAAVLGIAVLELVRRGEALVGRLAELARTDELTGLPNRRAWQELLVHELSIARRTGEPLAVALLDLDQFKDYNDTHGHLSGDRLLLLAAAAWQGTLRETDLLARWGGDEFGLILPGCGAEQGQVLVARMRRACPEAPFSLGLAEWGRHSSPDAIVAAADHALYSAKVARQSATEAAAAQGLS